MAALSGPRRVGPRNAQAMTCADGQAGHPLGLCRVVVYRGNHSAFNGYAFTPSDYSAVECTGCGTFWRTSAAYVEELTRC